MIGIMNTETCETRDKHTRNALLFGLLFWIHLKSYRAAKHKQSSIHAIGALRSSGKSIHNFCWN